MTTRDGSAATRPIREFRSDGAYRDRVAVGQGANNEWRGECPSEHTFEGQGTDMELHLVHKSAAGVNAVVGVKVVRGPSSGALGQIFAQLPDDLDVHHPLAAPFNPRHFLPADRDYYRYEGSLTTPPCTEGVHWLVLKDPITVSSEDLAQYHERIHFNARPVQRFSR